MPVEVMRNGRLKGTQFRQCSSCGEFIVGTDDKQVYCPVCQMLRRTKDRATRKGIEYSLVKEDLILPEKCPILDIPLEFTYGLAYPLPNSPSIDRKDNTKGYTKDNVWVVSFLANTMKSSANKEQLIKFGKWIYDEYCSHS